MTALTCPYNCGITFDRDHASVGEEIIHTAGPTTWTAKGWICPGCRRLVVDLVKRRLVIPPPGAEMGTAVVEQHRVWPKSSRSAPREVPSDLARDFHESATVLDDSPRAAAALARRCLQQTLTDHLAATGRNLSDQIDSVETKLTSPVYGQLHAIRNVGNFAAHPINDRQADMIVDVEPGEAEWTLDALEALFDFVFVAPAAREARRIELNQKLKAAGKPELDDDGNPIMATPDPQPPPAGE